MVKTGKRAHKNNVIYTLYRDTATSAPPLRSTKHTTKKKCNPIFGIDPGLTGSIVLYDGEGVDVWAMPVNKIGKHSEIDFERVHAILHSVSCDWGALPTFLERAVSFGMGSTGAFNYGRGFATIEIALKILQFPTTYVEPGKWTKEMHQGIAKDLKPKAKSLVAVERLFPKLVKTLPRNTKGRLLEGPVDALLIAGYGYRQLFGSQKVDIPDFY